MLTDKHGNTWTPNAERTMFSGSNGINIIVNPEWTDAAILDYLNADATPVKSDAERIAELEAQLATLLARLS